MRRLKLLVLASTLFFVACKKKDVAEQSTENSIKESIKYGKSNSERSGEIKFPNDPLNLKFDVTKFDKQAIALYKNKKISDKELKIIDGTIAYATYIRQDEVSLDGKTFREILNETKNDKELMDWINSDRFVFDRKNVDNWFFPCDFSIYEKWVDKSGSSFSNDEIYLSYKLKNNSDKDIEYLKGTLRLYSVSNKPYHDIEIKIRYTSLKAGSIYKEDLRIVDSYSWVARLKKTEFEDLRYRFWVNGVKYTDGSGFPIYETGEVVEIDRM